jgi:1,4-dihydroxy-6-naphthoate synthase
VKLTVGFSPCPNDTFIFDALIHHKIDTEGYEFTPILDDVEKLNQRAFRSELDITKTSYHAYIFLRDHYALLNSGSALGSHCGPLLIAKNPMDPEHLSEARIGIPGKYTTANLLLQLFLKKKLRCREYVFSDIENALLKDEIDAGVIIHESRFTFASKGLIQIQDLGEFWETHTHTPIPLGGIVMKKSLGPAEIAACDRILRRSVQFAMDHPDSSRDYVRRHAQELDDAVIQSHIALYVNPYTLDLGEAGKTAVDRLLREADEIIRAPQIS